MKTSLITPEERIRAFKSARKAEVSRRQKLDVRYHVEDFDVNDRPRRFLEAFAAILKHTNYRMALEHFIRMSAKCSRCAVTCQVYQATNDLKDIPCYRSELLLSVYRRHFTVGGLIKGRLMGNDYLTDEKIREMAESFWNCTACRRCSMECPSGIDHGLITHLGRFILSEIGIAPRALVVSTREQLEGATGNTSAIPVPAMIDTLDFLEEDMLEEKGVEIKFPRDIEGADYVFFPAVSDFLMEAETLMGIAAVFTATGDSWTTGTGYFDGINYGLFYSDRILERVVKKIDSETRRLKGRNVLIGECGHASRSAKYFLPTYCGGKDAYPVINIMEYTHKVWKEGRLKFDPDIVTEKVAYHDPCNIARQRWIIDKPRELLKAFCKNYVEMTPSGENNICCGGGGGTVSIDEIRSYRTMVGGKLKADQIRRSECKILVAPCANCKKQLRELVEDQKIDCEVVGLHDLIYKAIIFDDSLKVKKDEVKDHEIVEE
ncbi:MAG: (Fe-S)-binding protein [candidate division Zixibacteria bacterium HGW-Zixibacteria-1]|nr:MAG: (Fe-S)-binding protein [candidate division Zixibacteria bacterium HGW-Zixibacteria-1]